MPLTYTIRVVTRVRCSVQHIYILRESTRKQLMNKATFFAPALSQKYLPRSVERARRASKPEHLRPPPPPKSLPSPTERPSDVPNPPYRYALISLYLCALSLSLSLSLSTPCLPTHHLPSQMVVVFTPQITWHGGDGGKNAPLFGISLLPLPGPTDLLATAGNDHCVHLWRSSPNDGGVEHVVTLTKCDTCVNCVRFSPDGLFLVACGDAGAVVVWSVPMAKRGGGNGKHYWNLVSDEKELDVKVLRSGCEDIYDVNWSACSKRFGIASLCHKVAVFEDQVRATLYGRRTTACKRAASPFVHTAFLLCSHMCMVWQSVTTEAEVTDSNPAVMSLDDSSNNGGWGGSGVWKNVVVLNDHRMMVQGVAFDPCNNYLVTQGSDRVVNVFMRKERKEVKKKGALKDNNSVMNSEEGSAASGATSGATSAGKTAHASRAKRARVTSGSSMERSGPAAHRGERTRWSRKRFIRINRSRRRPLCSWAFAYSPPSPL